MFMLMKETVIHLMLKKASLYNFIDWDVMVTGVDSSTETGGALNYIRNKLIIKFKMYKCIISI